MAITVRRGDADSNPIEAETAVHIDVTDLDPTVAYYIVADGPQDARDDGKSHVFQPSFDGKHTWDNYIFPNDGSYTIRVKRVSDDGDAQTQAVTVAAAS